MNNKSRLIVTVKRFKSKNGSDFINATTLNIYGGHLCCHHSKGV